MNYSQLEKLSFAELKKIANKMDIQYKRGKNSLIQDIISNLKEFEKYKRNKIDKYKRIKQLGNKGKEGITYLVETKNGNQYAMKTFKKQKSSATLRKEAELQKKASTYGICPKIVEIDTVSKYIVMEKMDIHLTDLIGKQNGNLKKNQQQQLLNIFKKLDDAGVFHGDANILNYMVKNKQIYIIDFGMSKEITPQLKKKLDTDTPNMTMMLIGLIMKLKDAKCPESSYEYLIKNLSQEQKENFHI